MQQLTVNSKEVNEWLQARNKLKKDWGFKLKGLHLQTKKVVEYLKTIKIQEVNDILSNSNYEE